MNPSTQEGWGLLRRFGLGALGERAAKGSTWVFAARILSGVLGLAITAMLARQLPAAEFGAFMLALSVVTVCALIARFGMEQGGLQLISQQLGRGAEATAARTAIKILLFVTVSGGLIALALAFGAHAALAEHLFGSSALALLGIPVALWMLAFTLQMLLAELFRGYGDVRMAAFLGGAVYGGALSSVLALVLIGGAAVIDARLDLRCAVLLVMMGNLASVVLGGILLLRRLKSAPRASSADIEVPSLARILAVGIPLLLVQVSFLVFGHADIWILAAFRSETEVGLYSAAARVAKFLGLVFLVVAEVIAPEIGRLHSRGERRKLEELLRISACFSTLPAILVFPLLLAVGDDLLALLFGELYRGAYPVLLFLTLGWIGSVLVGPAVITLVMTGQGLTLMVINVITTLVTVLLGIIITPRAGMQGLAAVVAGVIVTQHLAIWLAVRWRCGLWTHAAPGLAVRRLGGLLSGLKVRSHRA